MNLEYLQKIYLQDILENKNNEIGDQVKIFKPNLVNIYGAKIGDNTTVGPFVEIQSGASIGKNVKIQSHSFICEGVEIKDNCFIGHNVMFTNDKNPASVTKEGKIKNRDDWKLEKTLIEEGVNIGSNSTILPGIIIGEYTTIGAGSVVTKNCEPYSTYVGNPARKIK